MKPIEYFRFSLKSLWSRKLRSGLTIAGVSIGIALYVILLSQTQGLYDAVVGQIEKMGVNNVFVLSLRQDTSLSIVDVINIQSVDGVEEVVPLVRGSATVTFGGQMATFQVLGLDFSTLEDAFPGVGPLDGVIPSSPGLFSALIGYNIAYPPNSNSTDPLVRAGDSILVRVTMRSGRQILETYRYFTVSAVLSRYGISMGVTGPDGSVFVPTEVANFLFNKKGTYDGAIVIAADVSRAQEIADTIQQMLGGRFTAISPQQIVETAQSILGQVQFFLGAIAVVSLVVSGVGIANIMYISVIERVKIIGLYKALGMRKFDVAALYLVESGLIGILGGTVGILTGLAISAFGLNILPMNIPSAVRTRMPAMGGFMSFSISPTFTPELFITALGIALFVSMIAGLYPAYKASQLEAAQALKYE